MIPDYVHDHFARHPNQTVRPYITNARGERLSVQASSGHYCSPRETGAERYTHVEVFSWAGRKAPKCLRAYQNDDDTSIGLGTVDQLISAGDDNGCWVLGGDWQIVERRNTSGKERPIPRTLEYDVDEMAAGMVAQVRRAAAAAKAED